MTTIATIDTYNYNKDYDDYSDYNDFRDGDKDVDWERLSELVTQLTITDKVQNLNHDIEVLRFTIR